MRLDIDKNSLTIMGVQFENKQDFRIVWHSVSTNMFEGWQPTVKDVEHLKKKIMVLREKSYDEKEI
ncbi:MAG: hypothetical protein LBI41_01990 [Lactobacillales bacterium]|nr:hypothetical protein [Lactobacillales bacterium]